MKEATMTDLWYVLLTVVIFGLLAVVVAAAVFGWSEHREQEITAREVAQIERARLSPRGAA